MDTVWIKKNFYGRAVTFLWTRGRECPQHRRSSIHAINSGTEGIDRMGSAWAMNHHRILQNSEKENQDENHPMLHPRLQSILDKSRENDVIILMGDFNANIGTDNNGYEEMMGTQGVGEMNENGEKFVDTCALNNITIGGSMSTHKRIHKTTLVSPDHLKENQIDCICIGKIFRGSLEDVKKWNLTTTC